MVETCTWLDRWGWREGDSPPIAAYIHIPFCRHRCGYCNFSLLANRDDLIDRFLDCLEVELSVLAVPREVQTLFIGGGTPSILPQPTMERLLSRLQYWFEVGNAGGDSNSIEWTIEANPLDITDSMCRLLRDHGVNRISIGAQSFQELKLKRLERDHSPQQLDIAISTAQRYFDDVSLDLIFSAPNETLAEWIIDVRRAIESGVTHLSTYGLTYEKGSKFWGLRERKILHSLPEVVELDMYVTAIDMLAASGFTHYEISSFSRLGKSCRHNQTYWRGEPWWAFGPSAARFVGRTRSVNHRGTFEYLRRIESGLDPIDEIEELTIEQRIRERFVFGMRQIAGVNLKQLLMDASHDLGNSIRRTIERHVEFGWMIEEGDNIRLTPAGLVISDSLWSEYL